MSCFDYLSGPVGSIVFASRRRGVFIELRSLASVLCRPLRAPHHTVGPLGMMSELALSSAGYLVVDEADLHRKASISMMLSAWRMMSSGARPTLVFLCDGSEGVSKVLFEYRLDGERGVCVCHD